MLGFPGSVRECDGCVFSVLAAPTERGVSAHAEGFGQQGASRVLLQQTTGRPRVPAAPHQPGGGQERLVLTAPQQDRYTHTHTQTDQAVMYLFHSGYK